VKKKAKMGKKVPQILPLKDIVFLYVDSREESRKAVKLLKKAGISPFITKGSVGPLERKPLVQFNGGTYQGLKEIRELLELLAFWSKMHPDWDSIFKKENEEAKAP
jgi:hypothetical protein